MGQSETQATWLFSLSTMNPDLQLQLKSNLQENRGHVHLHVQCSFILSSDTGPLGHLYLLNAALLSLSSYTNSKVDWLICVARLICKPLDCGTLFMFQEGGNEDWHHQEMTTSTWRAVEAGEILEGRIYEYRLTNTNSVMLAKISSPRNRPSIMSTSSKDKSKKFCRDLEKCDTRCIVTGQALAVSLAASHLIPKRLGDSNAREIVTVFSGGIFPVSQDFCHFNPTLGVLLNLNIDAYMDRYLVGFWKVLGTISLQSYY